MNSTNTGRNQVKASSPEVISKLKQVQPELAKLLADSPEFGILSLELHILNWEIKRVISRKESSVILTKGGSQHETALISNESNTPPFRA